jgi:hypothetical protein
MIKTYMPEGKSETEKLKRLVRKQLSLNKAA